MVSVIVVGYKHSNYIIECLDSIVNQTYKDFELIIADDGSKDGTVAIVNNWRATKSSGLNIKTRFNDVNVGFCNTLNSLIPLCDGEFIKIIAADDKLHPTFLEKSVQSFKILDDSYGIVYSNAQIIDERSGFTENYVIPLGEQFPSGDIRDQLFVQNCIPALSALVRKNVYEVVGYYDPEFVIEDYYMWMKVARQFKFYYINEVLSYYRSHGGNISLNTNLRPQVVVVKLQNDLTGQYTDIIHKDLMNLYMFKESTTAVLKAYNQYPKCDRLLYYCLKFKLSHRIYKLLKKLW